MKLGATAGLGAAISGTGSFVFPKNSNDDELAAAQIHRNLPEDFVASVCSCCPALCQLRLRRVGSKIVGVLPQSPKPCPRAYAIPQEIYHPERIRHPMRGTGARGYRAFETVDRGSAVDEMSRCLLQNPVRSAILLGGTAAASRNLLAEFALAVGCNDVYVEDSSIHQGPVDALRDATGWDRWNFSTLKSNGVISFGFEWLQSSSAFPESMVAFQKMREQNLPIIFVGSRYGTTAMRSKEWVRTRAGYEPLVALTICAHIIKQEKHARSCDAIQGFGDFAKSIAALDVGAFCKKTGVSPREIHRISDILIGRPKILAISCRGRLEDQWPVVLLNIVLGSVGTEQPLLPVQKLASPATAPAEGIPEKIERGDVESLVIVESNPVFGSPNPNRWRNALCKVKRLVVLGTIFDESCAFADVVLPLSCASESSDVYAKVSNSEVTRVKSEPAVPKGADMFDLAHLVFDLAKSPGGKELPWRTLDEYSNSVKTVSPPDLRIDLGKFVTWKDPVFEEGEFHVVPFVPTGFYCQNGGHLPYLLTTAGAHLREFWTTFIEINKETAHRLGIEDREIVILKSGAGEIEARARYYEGVPPDVIGIPLGLGHRIGSFAQKIGGNPSQLFAFRRDERTGAVLWNLQKISIRRIH